MVALPTALRARHRQPSRAWEAVAATTARLVRPHRAALSNLVAIPLTTFGIGCIDTGVFYASFIAGWIVTGLSLIFLEHLIADE
jgi:hypothetical protein